MGENDDKDFNKINMKELASSNDERFRWIGNAVLELKEQVREIRDFRDKQMLVAIDHETKLKELQNDHETGSAQLTDAFEQIIDERAKIKELQDNNSGFHETTSRCVRQNQKLIVELRENLRNLRDDMMKQQDITDKEIKELRDKMDREAKRRVDTTTALDKAVSELRDALENCQAYRDNELTVEAFRDDFDRQNGEVANNKIAIKELRDEFKLTIHENKLGIIITSGDRHVQFFPWDLVEGIEELRERLDKVEQWVETDETFHPSTHDDIFKRLDTIMDMSNDHAEDFHRHRHKANGSLWFDTKEAGDKRTTTSTGQSSGCTGCAFNEDDVLDYSEKCKSPDVLEHPGYGCHVEKRDASDEDPPCPHCGLPRDPHDATTTDHSHCRCDSNVKTTYPPCPVCGSMNHRDCSYFSSGLTRKELYNKHAGGTADPPEPGTASCDNCRLKPCKLYKSGNPYNCCRDWAPLDPPDPVQCQSCGSVNVECEDIVTLDRGYWKCKDCGHHWVDPPDPNAPPLEGCGTTLNSSAGGNNDPGIADVQGDGKSCGTCAHGKPAKNDEKHRHWCTMHGGIVARQYCDIHVARTCGTCARYADEPAIGCQYLPDGPDDPACLEHEPKTCGNCSEFICGCDSTNPDSTCEMWERREEKKSCDNCKHNRATGVKSECLHCRRYLESHPVNPIEETMFERNEDNWERREDIDVGDIVASVPPDFKPSFYKKDSPPPNASREDEISIPITKPRPGGGSLGEDGKGSEQQGATIEPYQLKHSYAIKEVERLRLQVAVLQDVTRRCAADGACDVVQGLEKERDSLREQKADLLDESERDMDLIVEVEKERDLALFNLNKIQADAREVTDSLVKQRDDLAEKVKYFEDGCTECKYRVINEEYKEKAAKWDKLHECEYCDDDHKVSHDDVLHWDVMKEKAAKWDESTDENGYMDTVLLKSKKLDAIITRYDKVVNGDECIEGCAFNLISEFPCDGCAKLVEGIFKELLVPFLPANDKEENDDEE